MLPKPFPELSLEGTGAPPHAEKSLDIGIDGTVGVAPCLGFGAVVVGVGSGVAHTSPEPQASMFEKPDEVLVRGGWAGAEGLWGGCTGAAGAERLNAELTLDAGAGSGAFCGAGGDGSEKSKRSLEAGAEGLYETGAGLDAKLKSPKSLDERGSGFV